MRNQGLGGNGAAVLGYSPNNCHDPAKDGFDHVRNPTGSEVFSSISCIPFLTLHQRALTDMLAVEVDVSVGRCLRVQNSVPDCGQRPSQNAAFQTVNLDLCSAEKHLVHTTHADLLGPW